MSDEDAAEVGDNDADKRPRIYGRAADSDSEIEVTVQGGEGEKAEDLTEEFDARVDKLREGVDDSEEDDRRGFE